MVYVNLDAAKEFLLVDSVPQLVVVLEKTEYLNNFYQSLTNKLTKWAENKKPLVAKKWSDLASYYLQVEQMYANNYQVISIFILLVVVFAIVNTMMMTVLERVREIGTLRAIGSKKMKILAMFLTEGGIIGLIGGILGVLTGLLAAFVINNVFGGIYIPPPPGRATGYQAYITPGIREMMINIGLAFLVSLGGTIFPAIKAIRMKIADSLRFL
jgi:putative ABC transport system permease protein